MHLPAVVAASFLALSTVRAQGDLAALLQTQPDLSTLLSLVSLVPGLNSTLSTSSNITIIAPTNSAFQAIDPTIPEGVAVRNRNSTSVAALLANHVFRGYYPSSTVGDVPTFVQSLVTPEYSNSVQPFTSITGGQYNGLIKNGSDVNVISGEFTISNVTQADIRLGDGIIIHKVDTALSFGAPFELFLARAGYLWLDGALVKSGLQLGLGLTSEDDYTAPIQDLTIFVPVDQAFEAVGSVIENADQDTLQAVLGYHVITDNIIFSPSLGNVTSPTLQGNDLTFSVLPEGDVFVNNARVLFSNVILSNGVAHIIDSVLSPNAPPVNRESLNAVTPAPDRVNFENATPVTQLPFSTITFASETTGTYSTPPVLLTASPLSLPANATATATASGSPVTYTGAAAMPAIPGLLGVGFAAVAGGVVVANL